MTETHIDIRLRDFDHMGIVHHAVYPVWFEIARLDFFERIGFPFTWQNQRGIDPVMVNLDLNYLAPLNSIGQVTVQTKLLLLDGKKMKLGYECLFDSKPVHRAESFHIWTKRRKEDGFTNLKSIKLNEEEPEFYAAMQAMKEN